MALAELKKSYDQMLKEFENKPELFCEGEYGVYFKWPYFCSEIVQKMKESDHASYITGAGSELSEHTKNGKRIPASMSSVASSSRFCYLSLKDSDFSVFRIKNYTNNRRFEEKMPIVKGAGTPPHMDCYYEDDEELVCFECKCHEQFDDHNIVLAESYFKDDRIVTKIAEKYYVEKHMLKKDKKGNPHYYNVISPAFVGLPENPRFDIKQFLTHIMGIQARLEKLNRKKVRLIYYYFIPDGVLENKEIKKVIDQLYCEIKTVFSSDFVKRYASNIQFELFVQFSKTVETASRTNTKECKL